ncbi:MAG: beta-propeller fold lactonase family protein, partial [bacterium]
MRKVEMNSTAPSSIIVFLKRPYGKENIYSKGGIMVKTLTKKARSFLRPSIPLLVCALGVLGNFHPTGAGLLHSAGIDSITACGTSPRDLVLSSDDQRLDVACGNGGDGVVCEISTSDYSLTDSVFVDYDPLERAITPCNDFLYVTNTVNGLYTTKIPIANKRDIRGGIDPSGVAVTPDCRKVYIASHWSSYIQVLSSCCNEEIKRIYPQQCPGADYHGGMDVAITPEGQWVYVTARTGGPNPGSGLYKISTVTDSCVAVIPVSGEGLDITPDGEYVYVAGDCVADTVWVVSVLTDAVEDAIPVGSCPTDVKITPDGAYAYVTNGNDNTVSAISTASRTVICVVPVGACPRRLTISSDGEYVYVACPCSDNISVIHTSQCCSVTAWVECPEEVCQSREFIVPVNIDVSGCPPELLGSYTARLVWDTTLVDYVGYSGGTTPAFENPTVNEDSTASGHLEFADANPSGAGNEVNVINVTFHVVGEPSNYPILDLEFSAMAAAMTFKDLLPYLAVDSCIFHIRPPWFCGDINTDGLCNSTDALICLSYDVG